jgi:hypothetical protein
MQSMSPLDHLDAELATKVHQRTEQLLSEALDYLSRLPAHPMTNEMIRKLSGHLEAPTTGIVRERDKRLVSQKGISGYAIDGLIELAASVGPTSILLTSPAAAHYIEKESIERGEALAFRLLDAFATGLTIQLAPPSLGSSSAF